MCPLFRGFTVDVGDALASGIENVRCSEALQQIADIAKLVSRCFDFELRFGNQERVKKTGLRRVHEDTFSHHGVRTGVENSTKQKSIRYEFASAKSNYDS